MSALSPETLEQLERLRALRVAADAAALPPRWIRSARAHRYRHETGDAGAWVSPDGKALASLDAAGTLGEVAELVRDMAALVAWLEAGHR